MLAEPQRTSVAERIHLIEDIGDSIAATPDELPLTDAQREELDRRLEAMQENAQEGISWTELKASLLSR